MTTPLTPEQVQLSYSSAQRCIDELCQGSRKWTMSVPARPDHDPDLVICRALEDQQKLITALLAQVPADERRTHAAERRLEAVTGAAAEEAAYQVMVNEYGGRVLFSRLSIRLALEAAVAAASGDTAATEG